jgi:hypothetical protein
MEVVPACHCYLLWRVPPKLRKFLENKLGHTLSFVLLFSFLTVIVETVIDIE